MLNSHARAGQDAISGFFFRETRYLSVLRLLIAYEEPVACSVAEAAPNELEYSLIYPAVQQRRGGGSGSGGDHERHGVLAWGLDLDLRFHVRAASIEATLTACNRWNDGVEFDLGWQLAADFAGTLDLLGEERQQSAEVTCEPLPGGVRFRYDHPELPLETRVEATGGGDWHFARGRLSARLRLARHESAVSSLRVRALDSRDAIDRDGEEEREAHLRAYLDALPLLHAPAENPPVGLTASSLRDIGAAALLDGPRDEWLMPAAGYPLYAAARTRSCCSVL